MKKLITFLFLGALAGAGLYLYNNKQKGSKTSLTPSSNLNNIPVGLTEQETVNFLRTYEEALPHIQQSIPNMAMRVEPMNLSQTNIGFGVQSNPKYKELVIKALKKAVALKYDIPLVKKLVEYTNKNNTGDSTAFVENTAKWTVGLLVI